MWGGNQGNPGVYISGTCSTGQYGLTAAGPCSNAGNVNARRLLDLLNPNDGSYYGSISQLDDGGNLRYNGLVLSVQRRASKGLTVQANYTWSHCIADLANPELGVAGSLFMIPGNRRADLGNCPLSDRRHLFNLSAVYQTPKISGGALQAIARDWQISGIVRLQTGPYFGITSGLDQALTGQTAYERPNQVLASPYTPGKPLNAYLNLSAFSQPTPGTYGNMSLDNLLAPGFVQIDMGLVRTFPIRERMNFQFRAEAFNLPNHMNPDPCLIAAGSAATTCTPMGLAISQPATFGKIQSAKDPRIMQLALKFVF
jgi:hypothetical protein